MRYDLLDRLRVERAVLRYDLWLDLRGVPGRRRRDLRRELRANLRDAAEDVGVRTAVDNLGNLRRLAADAVVTDRSRPAWTAGLYWAAGVLVVLVWVTLLQAAAFADGVVASGVDHRVEGGLTLLPGVTVEAHAPADGRLSSFAVTGSVLLLLLPLAAFLLASRPWRLVTRGRTSARGHLTTDASADAGEPGQLRTTSR